MDDVLGSAHVEIQFGDLEQQIQVIWLFPDRTPAAPRSSFGWRLIASADHSGTDRLCRSVSVAIAVL